MASVLYWSGSWVSGGDDLAPGETHPWAVWFFRVSDVVSVTAFPVTGNPFVTRTMMIRNLRTEGRSDGLRVFFDVVNVGNASIPGYFFNLAMVNA